MSTHAAALGIAALAYRFARIYASDTRLTFGTGKLGELAEFSNAIMLAMIALFIGYESATRLLYPRNYRLRTGYSYCDDWRCRQSPQCMASSRQ